MSAPFITFTLGRVREGKLAAYRQLNRQITDRVKSQEPRVIAFHVMASEDGTRFLGMQFHPDAQSMEFHLQVVRELIQNAGDYLEIEEYRVLGPSSDVIDRLMGTIAESGVNVDHFPNHLAGFTRSSAAD